MSKFSSVFKNAVLNAGLFLLPVFITLNAYFFVTNQFNLLTFLMSGSVALLSSIALFLATLLSRDKLKQAFLMTAMFILLGVSAIILITARKTSLLVDSERIIIYENSVTAYGLYYYSKLFCFYSIFVIICYVALNSKHLLKVWRK